MGYRGKSRGIQTEEQHHRTLSRIVLKRKFCEAVQFFCDREKGRVLQPEELAEDRTGTINKTVVSVFGGKLPCEKIPSCDTLKTYYETPILIPVDITEKEVELVPRKL